MFKRLLSGPFFFFECLSSFVSRLQSLDFVRCLTGQASLKQLWYGLLCFSTSVDTIILLRTTGFIAPNAADLWCAPFPLAVRAHVRPRVQPHVAFALPFPLSDFPFRSARRKKNASHFLGSHSWTKITGNGWEGHFAEGADSSIYHRISLSKWCMQQLRQEFGLAFMSWACESACAGVREHSWPVCYIVCETVMPLWYYNPSTLSIFCCLHGRLKGRIRWSSPTGTRVIDSL